MLKQCSYTCHCRGCSSFNIVAPLQQDCQGGDGLQHAGHVSKALWCDFAPADECKHKGVQAIQHRWMHRETTPRTASQQGFCVAVVGNGFACLHAAKALYQNASLSHDLCYVDKDWHKVKPAEKDHHCHSLAPAEQLTCASVMWIVKQNNTCMVAALKPKQHKEGLYTYAVEVVLTS